MSSAAQPPTEAHELRWWRREREARGRGLRQLKNLRKRALADPEFAAREAADLEIVPDESGMVPSDGVLVAGYYSELIDAYERRAVEAQRNAWLAEARCRTLSLTPRSLRTRPRAREHAPRRERVRSSAGAARDGPDDSEPHLARSPTRVGRLGVRGRR